MSSDIIISFLRLQIWNPCFCIFFKLTKNWLSIFWSFFILLFTKCLWGFLLRFQKSRSQIHEFKWFYTARDIPQIFFFLGNFECKKSLIKNCKFFWKISLTMQNYSSPISETSEKTLSIENTHRFWFKRVGKFLISENMHFLAIFRYLQISFAVKSSGVDQVLTKILQIDQKLTFNVFHILNQVRISKIEKISDGTDPPPKKRSFLGGV